MEGWRRRLIDASALVALLGLVYVVGGVTLWVTELAPESETAHRALYQLVVHVLFGGVILALGVHVERSELRPEERFSVLVWCYGGFTPMFLLRAWGHLGAIIEGAYTVAFVSDFVVFTSLGGAFGVIVGLNRGRATKNRLLAERNEDQRETLALLTRLVSHDIRNDMAIGKGYAEIVAEHVAEEDDYAVRSSRPASRTRSNSSRTPAHS
jgi:signal transduction histidine kinase